MLLFNFWLFVFSVHFVHSLRSNSYQNGHHHLKKSNSYQTTLQRRESRFKNNLETKKSYQNGHGDQLLAEESNIDQFIEHNHIIPESSSNSYSTPKNKPQPYAFGYESDDGWGTKQYRSEKKQGHQVTGSYGYIDKNGIYRHVQYIADKQGFRARIRTNEPGTANKNPASVIMESTPAQINNKDDYKADTGDYKHQATELVKQHIEPQYSENRIRSTTIRKQQQQSNGQNNYSNIDDLTNKDELNKNFLTNDNQLNNDANFINNDHHNNHLNNNQNNLIRDWNDQTFNYPSDIHYRNEQNQQNDQLNEQIENNSEQNDQIDDQQDDDNYQINQRTKRKNLFRSRL